jgi:hypothetical protein
MKLRNIAMLIIAGSGVLMWGVLTALDIWLGRTVGEAETAEKSFLTMLIVFYTLWLSAMLDMWKGEQ